MKTYLGNPILAIVKGISAGKEVDFGVYRDDDDSVWQVNLDFAGEKIKTEPLTKELKIRLLGDLAYVYGSNTKKFEKKLKDFGL